MTRTGPPTNEERKSLLYSMKRFRAVEETIALKYGDQKMRCPVHLSTGQEAVSAGVGLNLLPEDLAVSGHRAHIHYLCKGGSLKRMLAEIYGKATGCCKGKGGSMHLIDESVGFMGSTAIVGGTIPVGTGLALALSLRNTPNLACVFLGDGAVEEGVFYESVNFAVLKKLPVLYVCENNLYSVYSHLKVRQPEGRAIHEMVTGLGLPSDHGDGNNPVEVFLKTRAAVRRIREGAGPFLLEFTTYRWREHCGPNFDNDIGYRTEAEYLQWKARDPIPHFQEKLLCEGQLNESEIDAMERAIGDEVNEAFLFAENSPFPDESDYATDLFFAEN
jgi:pyruvate dehydrogenase E1 component alpha subunit